MKPFRSTHAPQVSVVVFLAQGFVVSASLALIRTVVISGVFAVVDALTKVILLSRLHLSLFIPLVREGAVILSPSQLSLGSRPLPPLLQHRLALDWPLPATLDAE